jgi:Flp pilus assembly protein CpaB
VLVATKAIPKNTPMAEYQTLFTPAPFPGNTALPANCLANLDQLKERARNGVLKQAMNQGEPLSADNVVDRTASLVLTLRPGYNALAVRATAESSFFGLIEPDNYVKILSVRKLASGEKKSAILMKNIRVLAVDRVLDPMLRDKPGVPNIITLEVTDDEMKTLSKDEGALTFGIMAPGDLADRHGEVEEPLAQKVEPPVKPVLRQVVVARGPLPRGTPLKDLAVQFTVRDVPQDHLPNNFVSSLDDVAGKIEGMIVVKPMKAGEPLSSDYFMAVNSAVERETLMTIIEGEKRRVYAKKADGRMKLIESSSEKESEK